MGRQPAHRRTVSVLTFFVACSVFLSSGYVDAGRLDVGFDAAAMLQFQGTRDSKLTPIPNRLRIWGRFSFTTNASFYLRTFASGGRNTLHGLPGAFVPVNDISVYAKETDSGDDLRPRLRMDSAAFRWENRFFRLAVGQINLHSVQRDGSGVMELPGVSNPLTGFISAHFTRMLALNFMELENLSSIPALVLGFRFGDHFSIRTGLTCGNSGYHFFIRNTGFLEVSFFPSREDKNFKLGLILGASDADESGTHKLTPAAGINCLIPIAGGLTAFAGYSRAEEKNAISSLFGSFRWHLQSGLLVQKQGRIITGAGFSTVRHYSSAVRESVWEIFWNIKAASYLQLTPDFQLIHHPAGSTIDGKAWAVIASFKTVLFF